ncbi:MAG: gluconate 2-dehydrogenase subunit 3 family protein [Acidobacteriota bacterium]|nr:gluconate 2-dehydrogenase subunit 3 family protein [Acidobacteriota bacterium]
MSSLQPIQETHDVIVIGSGAGGGTVAHVLTGLGLRVTLLEAGPMLDPYREFKEHQWLYEVEHRGAEAGGQRYFGGGKPFGDFSTTSGGWALEGEPYTVAAGAAEFIDLLCSQNDVLVDIYQRGLRWLNAMMRRRTGTRFLDASEVERTELLDALVEAGRSVGASELTAGVEFFDWVRRMTVDAYYTSPIGMADLQYQGNAVLTRFEVPQEALRFVARRIEEL